MRSTDAKVKRILEKDYTDSVIREGQEWYVGHGVFLERSQTKDHLLDIMEYSKAAVKSAQLLRNAIDVELGRFEITDNLYENVLDLGECLSLIELYAQKYIDDCEYIRIPEERLQTFFSADDNPVYFGNTEDTEDELPF